MPQLAEARPSLAGPSPRITPPVPKGWPAFLPSRESHVEAPRIRSGFGPKEAVSAPGTGSCAGSLARGGDHGEGWSSSGAASAGLYAARALARAPVEITLVDRRNHHLFQPLLYQVATATLNPSDIAVPIRSVLRRQKNVRVLLGEATRIDAAARRVHLADGAELPYDFLRARHRGDPLLLRARRLGAGGARGSRASTTPWRSAAGSSWPSRPPSAAPTTPTSGGRSMTFVIIGAGPTGVEMAGALAEIARHSLRGEFRSIDPRADPDRPGRGQSRGPARLPRGALGRRRPPPGEAGGRAAAGPAGDRRRRRAG